MAEIWEDNGIVSDWPAVEDLTPVETLDEYDGPCLFTVKDTDGKTLLAYLSDRSEKKTRYLLTVCTASLISDLESNKVSLHDALSSSWLWVCDQTAEAGIEKLRRIRAEMVPAGSFPRPGIYLNTPAEPFLSIKLVGPKLTASSVPATAIKRAADSVLGALKVLASHVLAADAPGRPTDGLRKYYDPPAREIVMASLEISFGFPEQPPLLIGHVDETLQEMSSLLHTGLSWAAGGGDPSAPNADWIATVNALSKLVPPKSGAVTEILIGGQLSGSDGKIFKLDRKSAQKISEEKRRHSAPTKIQSLTGRIREFDKDKFTFTIRNDEGVSLATITFSEEHFEESYRLFDADVLTTVFIEKTAGLAELITLAEYQDGNDLMSPH